MHTMTDADAAKAGLEKVTDFVEDKGVDGARASEAYWEQRSSLPLSVPARRP